MLRQYFSLSRMIDLRKVLSIDRPKMIAALTSDCRLPKLTLQFVDGNNARDVFPIVRVGHDPIRMDTQGYMMVQLGPGKNPSTSAHKHSLAANTAISVLWVSLGATVSVDRPALGALRSVMDGARPCGFFSSSRISA
jgi:hypothetical protein